MSFRKYLSINGEIKVWGSIRPPPALFDTRNSPPLLGLRGHKIVTFSGKIVFVITHKGVFIVNIRDHSHITSSTEKSRVDWVGVNEDGYFLYRINGENWPE